MSETKYIKSKYKYVSGISTRGKVYWRLHVKGVSRQGFETEREAAIAVDKLLIKKGKGPVNILIRKT